MGMELVGIVLVPILALHNRAGTIVELMAIVLGPSCDLVNGLSIF